MAGLGSTMRRDEQVGNARGARNRRKRCRCRDEPVEENDSATLEATDRKAREKCDLEPAQGSQRIAARIHLESSPDDLDLVCDSLRIEARAGAADECGIDAGK